jgi:drug/metabolite transporter (DMT)-like permease
MKRFIIFIEFSSIAALWGGSFLFMRAAGPYFGPIPLIALRVSVASLFLLPICFLQHKSKSLLSNWKKVFVLSLTNTALPFCLLAYATIHTNAGFGAILNATAPFFTGLIGWLWLKDKLRFSQIIGLVVGFLGVFLLVQGKLSFNPSHKISSTVAALLATTLYGYSVNYTKLHLKDIDPIVITTINQMGASLVLLPVAFFTWPASPAPLLAWLGVAALGIASTAVAFILFYRLINKIGTSQTIVVTFLIPVFGMLWGALFLGEQITVSMIIAAVVILLGTTLSTGLIKF